MKKVAQWSTEDVRQWLTNEGMQEYSEAFLHLDGQGLLQLSKADFQTAPLVLVTSDRGRQLLDKLETLRIEHHIEAHKNGHANGHSILTVINEVNGNKPKSNGLINGFHKERVQIHMPEINRSPFPEEWGKTGVACIYAMVCFVCTTIIISVVHERVPPKEATPPLPDKFFDFFDRVDWAFSICEINGMILVGLWLLQLTLLKYRSIVGRRFFFIVGTLYLYRCITMYITTLPVPGMHFKCSPKLFGDWESQMRRVMKMIAGGGLTITGSHHMCGDYLYSGHTVMLTLSYLFIKEYSPKRFWWYHLICWLLCAVGLFCILLAHDHYSIDVVVAYFITTRLFWWYHTMANQQVLKESSQSNFFSRVWWYRIFQYLEQNVTGIVPRNYQMPLSWPPTQWSLVKYSRIDTQCP
ncbi:phosphatidylcholine:ceramide cholinephosphotransferase 1-like [Oncorhynchus keta]|uniref:phosphatidylcholine:ceramide cholinephosphotransferase 1-like n=1 Tax=Oncorhynchus keta TaxID=8018 RepID=UPI0015FDEE23|nr:phosphatidylcholine:ceramide cholinephosphotransferase 1-like [Oncorhynchus keta]XP_035608464.1 phosphatidylcholine:ceramide cholinephosphotransferase 1-like [Oncorhynchus keta]XP_035608472.1 phosphatidylcholine:ceramide cholinephosphotransferase 1-like [Oncorhynchus keta]XP_035608479.1 phosphatidylcholine:ceramide cholinephosphotransferase 1-like [Oncorhynchus keta]